MQIACFFFPHLPLQIEAMTTGPLNGRPVIIGGFPHERKPVIDVSPEAMACGVAPGIALRHAYGLCPEAVFLPAAENRYAAHFERILDILDTFSDVVEASDLGLAFAAIPYNSKVKEFVDEARQAVERQSGFGVQVGLASGKFVAEVAGKTARPGETIAVPPGSEKELLQGLSIDLLPGPEKLIRRLKLLGITEMGQLANLPRESVSLEFGRNGERVWDLANGFDKAPLIPWQKASTLENELSFDPPEESLDRLLAGAERLIDQLVFSLNERWQSCRKMTVHLEFAEDSTAQAMIYFKEPTSLGKDMRRYLRNRLGSAGFDGPVVRIGLVLDDFCEEWGSQLSLIDRLPKHRADLLRAARDLRAKYGKPVIKKIVLSGSESRLPERAFSFEDFALESP